MAAPDPGTKPRHRTSWWLGLVLVLAGLAVLGWVAWQFWGTNWVAHRTQERIVGEVEKKWEADGADVVRVPEGDVEALVRIPRFGDDYSVPVLEGTSDDVLAAGLGHFEDSAGPGRKGNYALAGHRITHGEPLRGMPDLEVGDEVIVQTRSTTYTYVLTSAGADLEVPFTAGWVVDPLPVNPDRGGVQPDQREGQRLITLTTCAELFHTDQRLVAFGVLEKAEPVSR
ncbi:class E sortase [Nocardioides sp. JQ2195]|uniref:class E sortase n=1 Tax=Nocardioides sp. JQ2195 TaxID=2592334 RepID=UPI00143EDDE5|nr:class E sortase [Nocardioides sp. JQ2195]QIX25399.1 class E sortase [Nocardioides sp. JQ2195]